MPLTRVGDASIGNVDEIYAISSWFRSTPFTGTILSIPYGRKRWDICVETPDNRVTIGQFDTEDQADKCMDDAVQQLGFMKLTENVAIRPYYVHLIRITNKLQVSWSVEIIFKLGGAKATWDLREFDDYQGAVKCLEKVTDKINSVLSSAPRPAVEAASLSKEICTSDRPANSSPSE